MGTVFVRILICTLLRPLPGSSLELLQDCETDNGNRIIAEQSVIALHIQAERCTYEQRSRIGSCPRRISNLRGKPFEK